MIYYNHYMIIKFIDFDKIIYIINLDVVLFFKVFNKFESKKLFI